MLEAGEIVAIRVVVAGKVQGVGFRFFVSGLARDLGITGSVKNLNDGTVEVKAYASKGTVELMVEQLRHGPPRSFVSDVDVVWLPKQTEVDRPVNFTILR